MRRLFVVLILLMAGILLLSVSGQSVESTPEAETNAQVEASGQPSDEQSQTDAVEASAPAKIKDQAVHTNKATFIIWFTFGIIAIALALLTWGFPHVKGDFNKID